MRPSVDDREMREYGPNSVVLDARACECDVASLAIKEISQLACSHAMYGIFYHDLCCLARCAHRELSSPQPLIVRAGMCAIERYATSNDMRIRTAHFIVSLNKLATYHYFQT